jgi:hypothetical protein
LAQYPLPIPGLWRGVSVAIQSCEEGRGWWAHDRRSRRDRKGAEGENLKKIRKIEKEIR